MTWAVRDRLALPRWTQQTAQRIGFAGGKAAYCLKQRHLGGVSTAIVSRAARVWGLDRVYGTRGGGGSLSAAEQDRVEPLGHLLDAACAAGQAQPALG